MIGTRQPRSGDHASRGRRRAGLAIPLATLGSPLLATSPAAAAAGWSDPIRLYETVDLVGWSDASGAAHVAASSAFGGALG